MKKTTFAAACLLIHGTTFAGSSSYNGEFLTNTQKKTILSKIDSVCADTWCEGDYGYRFDRINCDSEKKQCTLTFQMFDGNGSSKKMLTIAKGERFFAKISSAHSVACTVTKLEKFSDLDGSDSGELNDAFYEALSDCIRQLEISLSR